MSAPVRSSCDASLHSGFGPGRLARIIACGRLRAGTAVPSLQVSLQASNCQGNVRPGLRQRLGEPQQSSLVNLKYYPLARARSLVKSSIHFAPRVHRAALAGCSPSEQLDSEVAQLRIPCLQLASSPAAALARGPGPGPGATKTMTQ